MRMVMAADFNNGIAGVVRINFGHLIAQNDDVLGDIEFSSDGRIIGKGAFTYEVYLHIYR